jgi:hypothetical protein
LSAGAGQRVQRHHVTAASSRASPQWLKET